MTSEALPSLFDRHVLGVIKRWPSPKAKRWVTGAIEKLSCDPSVIAIVAVGSAVREVTASADVDLVVIYAGTKPELGNRPLDVDVKLYAADKVEQLLAAAHDYLVWAVRLGMPLVQRDGYWDALRRAWDDVAPWPDPCQSDARAKKAEKYHRELLAAGDDDAAQEQHLTMLTHVARARLLRAGVFPASRPELPAQLDATGAGDLASDLRRALMARDEQAGSDEVNLAAPLCP